MRFLLAVLLAVSLFAVASDASACGGYGVQQLNQGHCFQQQFVQPFYQQAIVVPQFQHFVAPQRVIVQRQVIGNHHRQQAIIQRQVVAPQRQVIRQRTVIRNR